MSSKKIPDNLTWPQFRAYYAKYGNKKKKDVSEAWKEYKNTKLDIPLATKKKSNKKSREPVKSRVVSPPKKGILKTNKVASTQKKKVRHQRRGDTSPSDKSEEESKVAVYEVRNENDGYISAIEIVDLLAAYFILGDEVLGVFSPVRISNKTGTKQKSKYTFDNGHIVIYVGPKQNVVIEVYYDSEMISENKLKRIDKKLKKVKIYDDVYIFDRIKDTDIDLISPEKRDTVKGRIPSIIAEISIVERDGKEKRTTISESIFGYLRENILEHAEEVREDDEEEFPVVPLRVEYIDNKRIKLYLNYNVAISGVKNVIYKLDDFFEFPYSIRGKKYKVDVLTTENKNKYF